MGVLMTPRPSTLTLVMSWLARQSSGTWKRASLDHVSNTARSTYMDTVFGCNLFSIALMLYTMLA
jgi:hypothetical protein